MMSLHAMALLLLVFIAYTPNPTLIQGFTKEQREEHKVRMAEWFDTERFPLPSYTKADLDYLLSISIKLGPIQISLGRNSKPVKVNPRSECRHMSRQRWNNYASAWRQWHSAAPNKTTGVTEHQLFTLQHRVSLAPSAHFSPGFLSWHREYLRRWENAMRKYVSSTSMCYLDWTLDRWMPNPCDSVIFSPDYFGSCTGPVTTGFAAGWQLYPPKECKGPNGIGNDLWRQCKAGANATAYLYNETQVDTFINSYSTYGNFCFPRNEDFEATHANIHEFIAGSMRSLPCSPNDPLFFTHHTNVDRIYQRFRDRFGPEVENQYPTWPELASNETADAIALPFNDTSPPMRCQDGLSMAYDRAIKYEDVPSTCTTQAACGNGDGKGALWCNRDTGKCASKLKIGGDCTGYKDIVCYTESRCATRARCTSSPHDRTTSTCTCILKLAY